MNLLATFSDADIFPGTANLDPSDFTNRVAARAVVLNAQGQVYLLHITKQTYHKLPGGGVDEGEDVPTALERELLEEIGCRAEVVAEIGQILEYRNQMKWRQVSHCFLARQVGELQPTQLEPSEIAQGAETVIAENIDDAIRLLEQDTTEDYEGQFILPRDLILLKAARDYLNN